MEKKKQRIGLYICHCGGNISDYVNVEEIGKLMQKEDGVLISKDVMFTCADSNQKDMIQDIREKNLDAIVVASCSPKLHLHTFQEVAKRAGLNPSNYVQVNIREQCSWPHSDKPKDATMKAVGLIQAGVKRVAYSESLENIEVEVKSTVLVVGAGISGMRSSIELARLGYEVYLVEKESVVGGHVAELEQVFMSGQNGKKIINDLYEQVKSYSNITLFTNAVMENVSGSIGNFSVDVRIKPREEISGQKEETLTLHAGAVLVATGFDPYQPKEGEYGYGTMPSVVTLPEFNEMIRNNPGKLVHNSRQIRKVSFIYCVGNRQNKGENKYCSRHCCTSTIHTSIQIREKYKDITSFHLYRDIRTYGKQEVLFEKSSRQGDIYIRFDEKEPPQIEQQGKKTLIRVTDYLTEKRELELEADLVVLVTGMEARKDSTDISAKFKIPIGNDKFFNEIHPKLKPVETVIKGVFIGGSCQGPKNITESVQSSLAATAKINALLGSGKIQLAPIIARVNQDACTWCGKCAEVCDYDSLVKTTAANREVALVNRATCAGCGICAPVCPENAIDLAQYTDSEIESMIDGFMMEIDPGEIGKAEAAVEKEVLQMREYPQMWKNILSTLNGGKKTIPEMAEELNEKKELVTYHVMTMNRYGAVVPAGMDEDEEYYYYSIKN
ncbi:MAG: CoB--CoM heterodisulfide reductase iron-sulfur subunit A family protein [Bacteroidales bacterium]|nr:CoB--CoM heterodisulfide reductase iron-sulfur subunit A family protein [Bacteroidales bacterium]